MNRRSLLISLLLLSTICPAFGAPLPTTTASAPQTPPPGAPVPVTPADAIKGYTKTVTTFQYHERKAVELESFLKKLRTESVTGNLGDSKKQRTTFLARLNEKYPGSTFDSVTGEIVVEKNVAAPFNATLDIDSIRETNRVVVTYLLRQGRIQIASGQNSVTAVIDQADPSRSKFINANIPAIKVDAEKILPDPDRNKTAAVTVEAAILNEAYKLCNWTSGLTMDSFAADVILKPESQKEALRIAANGYRERLRQDSQGGADPLKSRKKQADTTLKQPEDARFIEKTLKWMLLIILSSGVLWAVLSGIRILKSSSMDTVQKMHKNLYNSLSPLVMKVLGKMGASLWGRNLPWSKNFYIYQRSDRWLLCDGKEDKINKIFQARTRVEVCLRSTYFKIRITRLNGVNADISLTCKDFSELELTQGLNKMSSDITNARRADEAAPEGPIKGVKPFTG